MYSRMRILAIAAVGALVVMLTPHARADAWNQKTVFTFSGPVEIPGQVLRPGTYVFKLMNSMADRSVVQVFNNNQTHCYGNFLTIPDYRMTPTSKPVITFEERAEGSPQAVKSWFYPGYNYGHQFLYHKAQEVASANAQPAGMAATSATTPPPVTEQAPATSQNETEQQTETAQAMTPPPATEQATTPPPATEEATTPPPASENTNPMPARLPQTGSDLPLIGLVGMLSLASALVLRRVRANS